MKKSIIIIVVTIGVILIGIGIYKQYRNNYPKDVIRIAAILPLTGNYAEYGNNDKKGIDLAVEYFKQKHPGVNISMTYEDNKSTPKDAVTSIKKLCSTQKPLVVFDDAISSITLSVLPEAEKNEVILMSTGATNPKLSGSSPFFFRVWNSDVEEGAFAAKAAIETLMQKRVIVIYINSDYGVGLKDAFVKDYVNLGGEVILTLPYDQNDKDFKNLIAKISRYNNDLIYMIGYANQTGLIAKTLRTNNYGNLILSTVATEDKKFIELAGKASEKIVYVYNSNVENDNYLLFRQLYKNRYKEDYKILTDVAFDAATIVLNIVKDNPRMNGKELLKRLREMPEFEGASGNIKFDLMGDVHKKMILKTIVNGQFQIFEKINSRKEVLK